MSNWRGAWAIIISIAIAGAGQAAEVWPQWGGPERDFTLAARELSRSWGEKGPRQLWERPLGGGFASIVGDGKRLYVAFRDGDQEVVAALNPGNGKLRWEHRYAAPIETGPSLSLQYGKGPNGTPLLAEGQIVTLGFTGHVRCLDASDGELRWSHDLGEEFDVRIPYFGHATSPLAAGKNAVVVAGGLHAFDLATGKPAWHNRDFEGSYGSPRLVSAGGKQLIVTPVSGHLAAFDPGSGQTVWSHELKNQWGTILTSPVLDAAGRVFISAAGVGSLLVDPAAAKAGDAPVWRAKQTQIGHSNAVRSGNWVFASVGESASFLTATSLEDGSQAWKERGFSQANLLRVGDEFLLLDFEGQLALVQLGDEGMKVVTQASINDKPTWTPPTLIGTTLYVRDESRIMALDLAARKRNKRKK